MLASLAIAVTAWAFAIYWLVISGIIAGDSSRWWLASIPLCAALTVSYLCGLFTIRAIKAMRSSGPGRSAWFNSGFSVLSGLLAVFAAIMVWVAVLFFTPGVYLF